MSVPGSPSPFLAGEDSNGLPSTLTALNNLHSFGLHNSTTPTATPPTYAPFARSTSTPLYHQSHLGTASPAQEPLFQTPQAISFREDLLNPRSIPSTDNRELRTMYIACANHDQLHASGNLAYQQCWENIKRVQSENAEIRAQLTAYKSINDNLIRAVPQLLAVESGTTGVPDPSDDSDHQARSGIATWALTRITLGRGMRLPTALPKPHGITFTYWTKTAWNNRTVEKSTRKRGERPQEEENVSQLYIEEVHEGKPYAEPASGSTVAQIRALAYSLGYSIRWSGQAPAKWSEATHEVLAYVYSILSLHYPMLLYCEGGLWKMELLMTNLWSGWAKNHLSTTSAAPASVPEITEATTAAVVGPATAGPTTAAEKRPGEDWYATPAPQAKRSRNVPDNPTSPLLSFSPSPPPLTVTSELERSSHGPSITLAIPSVPSHDSSVILSSLTTTSASCAPLATSASPTSLTSPRHWPSPTPAPSRDSTSPIPQPASPTSALPLILQSPAIPVASASPAGVASSSEPPTVTSAPVSSESSEPNLGSAAVGTTLSKSNLGPPNPFPVLRRTVPDRAVQSGMTSALPSPHVAGTGVMPADSNTSQAPPPVVEQDGSASEPLPVTTTQSSRRGGRTGRLASSAYDPSKSSGKNIFIGRMIDDNKDVTDSECQKAWMALTKAEKQVYNKEATENQRAQRTSTRNTQSQAS